MKNNAKQILFFPGCSLITSAQENYKSLKIFCNHLGYSLRELDNWNCCGTSSAHSLNHNLAIDLALRNLSLVAPNYNELLIACPTCFIRLKYAHFITKKSTTRIKGFEKKFGKKFPLKLRLTPFLEFVRKNKNKIKPSRSLNGLIVAPYYGCMRNVPPLLLKEVNLPPLIESVIKILGGETIIWPNKSTCCGTFLSAVRPRQITKIINQLVQNAIDLKAQSIVCACSMCHLTLEMRYTLEEKLPIFHFSEILSLVLGENKHIDWFNRHLINPIPLLKQKGLI